MEGTRSSRPLQFNPDPLRVVKHRLGESSQQEHRCDFHDGRGRCASYETTLTKPLYLWLCTKHEAS